MREVPLEQFRVVGPLYVDESGCILRKLALDEYAKLNRVSEDYRTGGTFHADTPNLNNRA
jgi:hypothetical protein